MVSSLTPQFVSVFVVSRLLDEPRYLLIKRCGDYLPGTWQMVSGGIDEGETAPQAALREIREETGLTPSQLYSADIVETFYMLSRNKISFVPVFVAFVDVMDVSLSPQEHDAFEWLPFEEAKERLVWAEQKRAIQHIHETCVLQEPHELLRVKIYE